MDVVIGHADREFCYDRLVVTYSDDLSMERLQTVIGGVGSSVRIDGLVSGVVYYFSVIAAKEDIFGEPSIVTPMLVGT